MGDKAGVGTTVKRLAETFLRRHGGASGLALYALKDRLRQSRRSRQRLQKAKRDLFPSSWPVVLAGPFKGMRYIEEFTFGPIAPRWLGTYEPQLHPFLRRMSDVTYEKFIDIGAAEGYYAVGVKRADASIAVISFEADPLSRRAQRRLARLNDVSIDARGVCNHQVLNSLLQGPPALVLCDIEGGELDLIDPGRCPGLLWADVIVETHPVGGQTSLHTAQIIAARFRGTHEAVIIDDDDMARRALLEEIEAGGLDRAVLHEHADEDRWHDNKWLVLLRPAGLRESHDRRSPC